MVWTEQDRCTAGHERTWYCTLLIFADQSRQRGMRKRDDGESVVIEISWTGRDVSCVDRAVTNALIRTKVEPGTPASSTPKVPPHWLSESTQSG